MADNITTSSATMRTKEYGGVHNQVAVPGFDTGAAVVLAASGAGAVTTGTQRVTLASDDPLVQAMGGAETDYETIAASQTDQVLGASGATGDILTALSFFPATTSPGAVSIKDGAGSAITVFTGGTDSVSNLVPFAVVLRAKSTAGAWSVTTGANVSVIATGSFT